MSRGVVRAVKATVAAVAVVVFLLLGAGYATHAEAPTNTHDVGGR